MKYIDPKLGVPLPERDYGGNCLIYDPGNAADPYHNIWVNIMLHTSIESVFVGIYLCENESHASSFKKYLWINRTKSTGSFLPIFSAGTLRLVTSVHNCISSKWFWHLLPWQQVPDIFVSLCVSDPGDQGLVDVYDHQRDVRISGIQPWTSAAQLLWVLVGPCESTTPPTHPVNSWGHVIHNFCQNWVNLGCVYFEVCLSEML